MCMYLPAERLTAALCSSCLAAASTMRIALLTAAIAIARRQEELRSRGWRLLTCPPDVVEELDDKVRFRERAECFGCLDSLPKHFHSIGECTFPCVVKLPTGEYGKAVRLAKDADELASAGA